MKRIICVGNRYHPEDMAGPAVHDLIRRGTLPADVEVVDGGLASLDLLRYVDGADSVVFVDQVEGFASPGQVVVLDPQHIIANAPERYDHSGGLPYLLRLLPMLQQDRMPQIVIVGIERQADPTALGTAAAVAVELAIAGPSAGVMS